MPLNRDPEWISASINFTTDLFKGGDRVRKMPFIWKVVAIKLGLIPEVNHVYATQKLAHKRIVPILKERMKAQQADPDWKAPSDMIQWIMEACRGQGKSFQEQAEIQLIVTMAAIHASTVAATNFVYDLVARPEYMAALRKEVDEAWDECDGQLDKKAMAKMMKMDSFLKESQRLNPAAHGSFLPIHILPYFATNFYTSYVRPPSSRAKRYHFQERLSLTARNPFCRRSVTAGSGCE